MSVNQHFFLLSFKWKCFLKVLLFMSVKGTVMESGSHGNAFIFCVGFWGELDEFFYCSNRHLLLGKISQESVWGIDCFNLLINYQEFKISSEPPKFLDNKS